MSCVDFLQSTVELGLDFVFPESQAEAVRLGAKIRELPNDHESMTQSFKF